MNPYVETMYVLQRRALTHAQTTPGSKASIAELRASVPAPVLAHFDRLIVRDRAGVAEVHHGVCGACHLRLPAAITAIGDKNDDLQLCESCGAYLLFPAEEAIAVTAPAEVRPRRRYRAATVALA